MEELTIFKRFVLQGPQNEYMLRSVSWGPCTNLFRWRHCKRKKRLARMRQHRPTVSEPNLSFLTLCLHLKICLIPLPFLGA